MFSLLLLKKLPVLEQLKLEEALLRADTRNWCLINVGTPPAIVMGISGKPEQLIDQTLVDRDNIPVIKRFSGGGTVYVDEETIFVTFISNGIKTPKPIFEFSKNVYSPFFPKEFEIQENDYVIGEKKFGGNAQYIQKNRWLHHTSFLWKFDPKKMDYLLMPQKRPKYRADRSHTDFLCTLSDYFECKATFLSQLKLHLIDHLNGKECALPHEVLNRPHRKSTTLLH
ncbi:MAG: hypothetical protein S4CHLAM45_01230 [Chlamydiales bacterium]|nr:hypothetical protein [Chlamydiales bacterium]MCH9619443.1 hypothetical protein [Chlamydiales bacterium]MCH9622247.1 hypothetical protein [Chlamydiales bacterium]